MATSSLPPSPPPQVNLRVILSETNRIINAHWRHFLALSVLFLLPVCFSSTIYQYILRLFTVQPEDDNPMKMVLFMFAFTVVVTIFNLLAIGSISYSVIQTFHGRPLEFISAFKASFASFFPLLATLISTNFIIFGILAILGIAVFLLTQLIMLIFPGLEFGYSSPYFQAMFLILMIIWIVIVIKLSIRWILTWVVVVAESVWGLTPLKRSNSLTNGNKRVSFSLILLYGVTQSILVWISSVAGSSSTNTAFFVLQIVVTSLLLTVLMLYNLVAITVMYMYCNAGDGTEELVGEYASLLSDNGKELVSQAYNNV